MFFHGNCLLLGAGHLFNSRRLWKKIDGLLRHDRDGGLCEESLTFGRSYRSLGREFGITLYAEKNIQQIRNLGYHLVHTQLDGDPHAVAVETYDHWYCRVYIRNKYVVMKIDDLMDVCTGSLENRNEVDGTGTRPTASLCSLA